MTATLPPTILEKLFQELNEVNPLVIRMSSLRSNIKISRMLLDGHVEDDRMKSELLHYIQNTTAKPSRESYS